MLSAFGVDHGDISKRHPTEYEIALHRTTKKDRSRQRRGNAFGAGALGAAMGGLTLAESGPKAALVGAGVGGALGGGIGAAIKPASHKAALVPVNRRRHA